jgi:hypothetical protein
MVCVGFTEYRKIPILNANEWMNSKAYIENIEGVLIEFTNQQMD